MPIPASFSRRPLLGLAVMLAALGVWAAVDWRLALPTSALKSAHYVGRDTCVKCHQQETHEWTGSDHDRAMEVATEATVLGDFNNAEFTRFDERTKFFRDGEKFMVNAEGPDGQYHDYEIKYTFGIRPLQQYIVEFPGGRKQVLRVSWDVAKKEWFYVAPIDAADIRIEADDPLHWTGVGQNWNTMCAECHVTDFHKNYDLATNTYDSKYFEIDVSCETCHGPGSVHVELAEGRSLFWDRNVEYGITNPLKNVSTQRQLDTCAPCHSRRTMIHPNYRAGDSFLDHFEPSLLEPGLYHADGQILDEVFEYASFSQSKMFHNDVRCTDCHNPHSLALKYEGNRLCAQCHQPGKYDGARHHRHVNSPAGSPETQCVTCHMPSSVYMGIDERRDHSIRVPRPDLTVTLGTPNVCNRCHNDPDQDAKWAADKVVQWYGEKRPDDPHYAVALEAARRGTPEAVGLAQQLVARDSAPDIVRATAVQLLGSAPGDAGRTLRLKALDDSSSLVRRAALRSLTDDVVELNGQLAELRSISSLDRSAAEVLRDATASFRTLVRKIAPKLEDRSRVVRLAAANLLAANAQEVRNMGFEAAIRDAIEEYRAAQMLHLDRAQANRNLGSLSLQLNDKAGAVEWFRIAIRQEPQLTGPRTELSQLLAQMLADPLDEAAVKKVNATEEEVQRLREQEVDLLERDTRLLAGDPAPHHHRGRLLYLLGREDEARQELAEACRLGPSEYEYWLWLALICEKQQRWEEAAGALLRMRDLRPQALEWQAIRLRMRDSLRSQGLLPQAAPSTGDRPANNEAAPPTDPGAGVESAPDAAAPSATTDLEEMENDPEAPAPVVPDPPGTPGRAAGPQLKD